MGASVNDELSDLERHIAEATTRVERQRQLVDEIARDGRNITRAKLSLLEYEETLAALIKRRSPT
jgi:cell division protein FtsL